jgi:hypothetical protein
MTNEFDKEIDSLLRKTSRGGETAFKEINPQSLHIDADEISLFAENALSTKMRVRVTEHLADCDRCRKILSNVITLNAETISENVHAKEITAASVSIPWYKKLFAFPQIAYAMGALALVFTGIIGVLILKNATDTANSSVAQMDKSPVSEQESKGASANSANTSATGSFSTSTNSNSMMANTVAMSNSAMPTPGSLAPTTDKSVSPVSAANSNISATGSGNKPESERDAKTDSLAAPKPTVLAKTEDFVKDGPPAQTLSRENQNRSDDESARVARQQSEISENSIAQNQAQIMPDTRNAKRSAPAVAARNEARKSVTTDSADVIAGETKEKTANTRSAGGKTFKRANGVWYDPAYKGGATTNVRRGTDEYKKLDSGLRSIAENLGGTVVVVWKGKAYRIQ